MNLARNPWVLILLIVLVVLLFGANKLPGLARNMGESMRIFKSEVEEMRKDEHGDPVEGSHAVSDSRRDDDRYDRRDDRRYDDRDRDYDRRDDRRYDDREYDRRDDRRDDRRYDDRDYDPRTERHRETVRDTDTDDLYRRD